MYELTIVDEVLRRGLLTGRGCPENRCAEIHRAKKCLSFGYEVHVAYVLTSLLFFSSPCLEYEVVYEALQRREHERP